MAESEGKENTMKLNPNCIRALLLQCEESLTLDERLVWQPLHLPDFCTSLPLYSRQEIAYTLYLLDDADYIETHIVESDNGIIDIYVYRLTYLGHEFIDSIRSNPVWEEIQSALNVIGSVSLPIIQELGSHFVLELLKHP